MPLLSSLPSTVARMMVQPGGKDRVMDVQVIGFEEEASRDGCDSDDLPMG